MTLLTEVSFFFIIKAGLLKVLGLASYFGESFFGGATTTSYYSGMSSLISSLTSSLILSLAFEVLPTGLPDCVG